MYCPICGEKLKDGQSVCEKCGSSVVINVIPKENENEKIIDEKENKKQRTIIVVLTILSLLFSLIPLAIILTICSMNYANKYQKNRTDKKYDNIFICQRILNICLAINIVSLIFIIIAFVVKSCMGNVASKLYKEVSNYSYVDKDNTNHTETIESKLNEQLNQKASEFLEYGAQ